MALTGRRLTLDEFLELPEESPALEYLDGVVVPKVSPKAYHGRTQYTFSRKFNDFAESRHLAIAFPETRSTFAGQSRVPDVGIYRWMNLPREPDGKFLDDFQTPWDIAVEIVSPNQSRADQEAKCRWYCANGVEISLMIDPNREDVIRFGADGSRVELRNEDRIALDSVAPGFNLTPDELFAALYPG